MVMSSAYVVMWMSRGGGVGLTCRWGSMGRLTEKTVE